MSGQTTILEPEVASVEVAIRTENAGLAALEERFRRIATAEEYLASGDVLVACAERRKRIDDPENKLQKAKSAAHSAWQSLCSLISDLRSPTESLERTVKAARLTFEREQERIRREAERVAREQAEREAALERQRAADLAALAAWELEESGAPADVVELEKSAPVFVPPPPAFVPAPVLPAASFVPKQRGISSREKWTADVIDLGLLKEFADEPRARRAALLALAAAVVKGDVPLEAIEPNMSFLRNQAKQFKSSLSYPGVVVWDEGSVSVRGK